jgi:hypothetical protein
MTHEGASAVFSIHEVASVRAAIQGARDAAMDLFMVYGTDFVTVKFLAPVTVPKALSAAFDRRVFAGHLDKRGKTRMSFH